VATLRLERIFRNYGDGKMQRIAHFVMVRIKKWVVETVHSVPRMVGIALLVLFLSFIWYINDYNYNFRYKFALVDNRVPTSRPNVRLVAAKTEETIYDAYGVKGTAIIDKAYHGARDYDYSDGRFEFFLGHKRTFRIGSSPDKQMILMGFRHTVPCDNLSAYLAPTFEKNGFRLLNLEYGDYQESSPSIADLERVNLSIQPIKDEAMLGDSVNEKSITSKLSFIKKLPKSFHYNVLGSDGEPILQNVVFDAKIGKIVVQK
jgi:hypothetical protein